MTATDRINAVARRLPIWVVYIVCALPAPWLVYLGMTGGLGVEPIEELEHRLGELAIQFLVFCLAITPLRRHVGLNLIRFRRAIGLISFYYVVLHLSVWLFLDVQIPAQIWADIIKRPYVTIGMAAFALMLPLALTSNNWSVRKLGPSWRQLHKMVYFSAVLAALHFIWLSKGFQLEPLMYLAAIVLLLVLRLPKRKRHAPA